MNQEIKQKTSKGFGILSPESRGPVIIGLFLLSIVVGAGIAVFYFLTPNVNSSVNTGYIDATKVHVDATAKPTSAYISSVKEENEEGFEKAKNTQGGVAMPITFDEEAPKEEAGVDISNCSCVIDDQQLLDAIKRLGIEGGSDKDNMRIARSDLFVSSSGQLMGEDNRSLSFRGQPVFMDSNGQLVGKDGIAITSTRGESIFIGKSGGFIDSLARKVIMAGDLLSSDGVVYINDGRTAQRSGNMVRSGVSDIYVTVEGQLVTVDGRAIRHSGAFVYQDDENKIINRQKLDIAWEGKPVYKNKKGELVTVTGEKFSQVGILFSYDGIMIDNNGKLTRPLISMVRIGESDIYRTKNNKLVDGYGLPITNYGENVRIGASNKLVGGTGGSVTNRNKTPIYLSKTGALKVDIGKGGIRSGVLKTSSKVALNKQGQMISRRGRMERRGTSDIYVTSDGLLADKSGKVILFNKKDTFLDFSDVLESGANGLETYEGVKIVGKDGKRVFLTLDGKLVDRNGNKIKELGVLSSSDGVMITASGKKVIQDKSMEQVVTKDGKPVTYNGKKVFKGADGRLYDKDGNPVLSPDGKAVFMDDNGNLVDEHGKIIDNVTLMAGERAVKNGELATRKKLSTSFGERVLHNGSDVYVDSAGRLIDEKGNPILTSDGREVFVDENGNLVDANGNLVKEELLVTEFGEKVTSGLVAGREQVVTKDGKTVKYNGLDVYKGANGALFDENGAAVLTKDGRRVFIDEEGNLVDKDGNIITDELLMVSGERFVGSGDLSTRKQLVDDKGNAVLVNGERVFIDDQGRVVDENGNVITTPDGREVFVDADGNLVDIEGNLIDEDILSVVSERALESGEITSVRQLTDDEGNLLFVDGKAAYVDGKGRLVDENGNVIKTADGLEIFVDENGILVDAKGKAVDDVLEKISKRAVEQGEISTVRQLTDGEGNLLFVDGKAAYVDEKGRLVDENGNVVKTADGREVFVDADGNLVDEDGNIIEEDIVESITHRGVVQGEISKQKQLTGADGKAVFYNGEEVYVDEQGRLIDADGNVVKTADGREVFVDADGNLVDKSGKAITEDILSDADGNTVREGLKKGKERLVTKDGDVIKFNGEDVFRAKDGSLVDANGKAILTKDGKKVFLNADGELVDEDGNLVKEDLLEVEERSFVNKGLKQGKERLVTKDGDVIKFNGEDVFRAKDGSLVDANGKAILTKDGKKVFLNADGELVDEDGNLVKEDLLEVEERSFVKDGILKGKEKLITKDGSEIKYKGKNVFKAADGSLIDANGKPILTEDGKKIFVDENGNLVDEDGDIVEDPNFKVTKKKFVNEGLALGLDQVITKDGAAVKYKGENVFKAADGSLIDADGNQILTEDGRKVYIDSDGNLVDEDGNLVKEPILTANNKPIKSGDLTTKPVSDLRQVGNSDIYVSRDGLLLDDKGRAITYNGKKVRINKKGQLVDENGNAVLDKNGNAVYMNAKGELVDRKGNKIEDSVLANGDGVLLNSNGIEVSKQLTRVGNSDLYKTKDGRIVDKDGKAVKYNGESVYAGEDGRLYYSNGRPVTDANGNSVYMNETGQLVDRNGKEIADNLLTTSDGVVIDSKGELVTSGGKLTRIPGTDLYKTENGQVVDANGKAVMVNGEQVYVDKDGKIVNRHRRAIRFKGREVVLSEDGRIVDSNGHPVTDEHGRAVLLSESGGFINEDGEAIDPRTGKSGEQKDQKKGSKKPGFKKLVGNETYKAKPSDAAKKKSSGKSDTDIPAKPKMLGGTGKKTSQSQGGSGKQTLTQRELQQLSNRYEGIKEQVEEQLELARNSTSLNNLKSSSVQFGGTKTSGIPDEQQNMAASGASKGKKDKEEKKGPVLAKAGSMLYAITSDKLNSDFSNKVVAEIIGLSPNDPLYQATAFGVFEEKYGKLVISFTEVCPITGSCVSMKGVALDPITAETGLGSGVDNHYLYRYGGLFVSTLLKGASIAVGESATREEDITPTGTKTTRSGLEGDKLIIRSVGETGAAFADVFADNISRPATAWLNPGEEMAIRLFSDVVGSEK